jgi:hypothetical protein
MKICIKIKIGELNLKHLFCGKLSLGFENVLDKLSPKFEKVYGYIKKKFLSHFYKFRSIRVNRRG